MTGTDGKIFGEAARGFVQMLARDVDGDVGRRPIERPQKNSNLLAGAAAKLDQPAARPHLGRDIARILLENRDLRPSRIIFWQPADLLE